jgi:hypothetical protein
MAMREAIQGLLASMLLVACGGTPTTGPDGGMPGPDGAPSGGITVTWSTNPPAFPGTVDSNVSVSSVTFRIATFEVIGDAGPDATTTQLAVEADWKLDPMTTPDSIGFPMAPPGVYSKLSAHLDGALIDESLEISGTAQVNGTPTPFKIHDRNDVAISIDVSGTLVAGSGLTFPLHVDFQHALDAVQYDKLDVDNGVLDLDTFDSQMPAFEAALVASFTADNASHN